VASRACDAHLFEFIVSQQNNDFLLMEDSEGMTPLFVAAATSAQTDLIMKLFSFTAFHPIGSNLLY